MDDWIDVGASLRTWWFPAWVAVTLGLLVAGGMMLFAQTDGGLAVLAAGGASAIAVSLSGASLRARRRRVRITESGFQVHDRHGERAIADDQVICASLHVQSNYTNGELKSTTRVFDVWVEHETIPQRVQMVNRLSLHAADPLAPLIERVQKHLYERARDALAARQPFEGEGWTLHAGELVVAGGREARSVRVDELAAVGAFDDDLCLWRHGDDVPVVRIPLRRANTHVLARLLHESVPGEPEVDEPPDDSRLGRVLFERKPSRLMTAAAWALPVAACGCVAAGLAVALARGRFGPVIPAAILGAIAGFVWLVVLSQYVRFRCHDLGVSRRWLWREERLRFADVATFAYSAVRQYVKGGYAGTTFTLSFVARPGVKPRKLVYSKTLRNADHELDRLRDHVSSIIAAGMAQEYRERQVVGWTEGLRFLQEGLEYRAAGFLGRKPPVILRFDQIQGYDAQQGVFQLWVYGVRKPVVKEQVGAPNFFPGYLLLAQLLEERQQTERAGAARQERVG
ncbi:MAG: hypothetical protein ACT4QC_15460 [Planctomycetaceae bacterium]